MNLTAPLFGMRPSGFPSQPVSFRTPPSFQRTSLSPNARPFIPAAHREAIRNAALQAVPLKDENASDGTPEFAVKAGDEEPTDASLSQEKEKTEHNQLFSPQQTSATVQLKSDGTEPPHPVPDPFLYAPTADLKPVKHTGSEEKVASKDIVQTVAPIPPPSTNESKQLFAPKAPTLKVRKDKITKPSSKPSGKKVTFSLSQPRVAERVESHAPPPKPESTAASESGQEGRLEEQKLKEEKNDDGFMYEVNHVPLSVRIGNGNVIKRGSLSTLRLAVVKTGEAKLDMFKEGASSLLLFESLSASRNILRVRKVANRPIMTVTVLTNNNGGTQVAKKYFVHLGHHLYDKIYWL
ncbi:unnamed protein product [Agarophyton chilense]